MIWSVGLTGGIGSGKTAAAEHFRELGAGIIDTDAIAHELTAAGGGAIEPVRQAFGVTLLTPVGALDRAAMRRRVFADPTARKQLEAILHPLIRSECEVRLSRLASADFPYAVLVVPLLLEAGDYRERVNRICVIDCPEETQIERTMTRSALSRKEVMAIIATQISRTERLAAAQDVIDNSAGLANLQSQVSHLHARYLILAGIG